MAVEAVHPEYLQQHVDDQWIVSRYNQFYMTRMTRAFEAFMTAGRANRIPFIGRYSE